MIKFLAFFCIFLVISCGYRISGYNDTDIKNNKKFLLEDVKNSYFESGYKILLENEVSSFLTENNMLSSENDSKYRIIFDLKSGVTSSNITSLSSQAVSSNITVVLHIKVLSKEGRVIYDKTFSDVKSFPLGGSISSNITSRDDAFRESVRDIIRNFRYEFDNSTL